MTNPTIKIVDVSTGEEIERPMNKDEFDGYKLAIFRDQKIEEEKAIKAKAKVDLLKKLGITEAEAELLLA
jgi:hypothetical protein